MRNAPPFLPRMYPDIFRYTKIEPYMEVGITRDYLGGTWDLLLRITRGCAKVNRSQKLLLEKIWKLSALESPYFSTEYGA